MNLREAAGQALEALQIWQDSLTDPSAIPGWRFSVVGEKSIANLRAALAEDRSGDTGKTSDHFADAGGMVATCQESQQVEPVATISKTETVEPVAWMRADRGHVDFHRHPDYLPLYTTAPPGIVARAVATERERIAQWVKDMCVGLDAKTIANGIRNGGNDDIRAFEVRK